MSEDMELLKTAAAQLGIEISPRNAVRFELYMKELLEWNQKFNLTAILDKDEIIIKHFVDSLSIVKAMRPSARKVIDVGSGAGFPGVPLAIVCPELEITLLDSLNKRVGFLRHIIEVLKLSTRAIHKRAEDTGHEAAHREQYDLCVSRAVASLSVLTEICLPLVKVGGMLIAMKGPDAADELEAARMAIKKLGGELNQIKKISLPGTEITHSLIMINKLYQTPAIYPRRSDKIAKKPVK